MKKDPKLIILKPCPFCNGKTYYEYSCHIPSYPIGVNCAKCKTAFIFHDKKRNRLTDYQKISTKFNKRAHEKESI